MKWAKRDLGYTQGKEREREAERESEREREREGLGGQYLKREKKRKIEGE